MAEAEKLPVTIEDEMRRSYLDYAMSVIIGRAIPNVRDGLKPVHRRILYSMYEQGIRWNGSYKKSARSVGDVLAKYHPHGDSAVYDALVRMAQDFAMRYPLVDGQGNFGSVDGDPAAAMRYTEVKMERLASELLADIEKDTVDFAPNFDESEQEPTVLPARFPNLLVNGSGGIAVGMATNIPPHNLTEIIDATVRLISDPELTNEQLMVDDDEMERRGVTGPDFPTAGFIYGTSGIRKAYETGRGRVVMRARATVEPMPGKRDREHIIITEIPYQVNKAELLKKIASLVREKRIEGISDLRDESDRHGMRVVVELKRDAFGEVVLNKLYQMTTLQSTFGYNCLAIVNGRPQLLDLRSTLLHFVEHRREIVTRRTRFELRQALQQLELVEGLGMAVTAVDAVVKTIRDSRDRDEAHGRLMKLPLHGLEEFVRRAGRPEDEIAKAKARGEYFLTERQAKAILDMRLARLTGLEREKLAVEFGELCVLIAHLRSILASDDMLRDLIVTELDEIKDRYGDGRRTEIVEAEGEISIEDLVAVEEVVLTVSQAGYIKRVPVSEYRAQARGGKGKRGMTTRDEDFITDVFVTNSHAHIIFLSNIGKAYLKKVYEIPAASRSAKGRAIVNLVGMEKGEELAAIVPVREFVENGYLLTCTRGGRVKRTPLSAYQNIRRTGIIGVGVGEGDQLLTARIVRVAEEPDENGDKIDDHVLIGTAHGMSIRFQSSQVRSMGRGSMGVRGIELRGGDSVVGVGIINDDVAQVLTIGECGYGKRTPVEEWTCQKRGGVGRIAMKVSDKTGKMVKLRLVHDTDQLMVITDGGQIIRTRVNEIRTAGRNTQGVIVIRLRGGETVVDVAKVTDDDTEETEDTEGTEETEGQSPEQALASEEASSESAESDEAGDSDADDSEGDDES